MRRIHLAIGLLGVIAFVITGQVMARHVPNIHTLSAEIRMMYVSRHIYLLADALVNLVLGLYLKLQGPGWRCVLQQTGSLLILGPVVLLLMAFFAEPAAGMAGRGWQSFFGLIALFLGLPSHLVASFGSDAN